MVPEEAAYRATRTAIDAPRRGLRALPQRPWVLSFTEHRTDPARFYAPHAYRRLCEVKRAYDPENLIRANHPILPA
jgi:hypothetical protein